MNQLVREEEPALEHLLEDQDRAEGLRRDGHRDRRQVRGERGPGAVLDLRDVPAEVVLDDELLARRNVDALLPHLDANAEAREGGQDRREVSRLDVFDRDSTAGDRGKSDEGRHLDVVRADPPLAAVQRFDALDPQDVRLDPLDARAERDEEAAQILNVRLAGGVTDHRLSRRQHRGHDRVLRRSPRTAGPARSPRRARRTHECADRAGGVRSRRRRAEAP